MHPFKLQNNPLKWLIVGGGIHGCYLANMLIRKRIVSKSCIRIVDPNPEPLWSWKQNTRNVGMDYLRSPLVHHLELEPFSLKHFSQQFESKNSLFISPNDRPALTLFNNHCESMLQKTGIEDVYVQGEVTELSKENEYFSVKTDHETFRSQKVILAPGQSTKTHWPEWAIHAKSNGSHISHVLDKNYSPANVPSKGTILVIGGGMSGAQTALSLLSEHRKVVLLTSKPLKQENYDSDPGWMGPKYLDGYSKVGCYKKRRNLITKARNKGTITHEVKAFLTAASRTRKLDIYTDLVDNCVKIFDDLDLVKLKGGDAIGANYIVLATGYSSELPGKELLKKLSNQLALNCADCGFPITDRFLQWSKNLFVSGALAELEVGPAARNIVGARIASERIFNFCKCESHSHNEKPSNKINRVEKKSA